MVEFGDRIDRARQRHPLIRRLDVVIAVMVHRAVSVQNHQWGVHGFCLVSLPSEINLRRGSCCRGVGSKDPNDFDECLRQGH